MMIFHSYVKLPEGRFVWRYGIQNPMIDFPIKKLVITWGIPHFWTDTHDNGCIFPSYPTITRSYPHSISLCIIYVYSFHIYIYTYMYIYIYIHTCIYDFPNKSMVVSCKHSVYSNLRGVVFFQRQGALLLALPLYQTNGVTGEPLGPRAKLGRDHRLTWINV